MERLHYMMFKWNFNCVLNFSKDVVLWMSLGRSFHRIMARGRKLLSVDFLLTTGTGYDDFLKLYILDVDIVSGKRDDKYLGESFRRILNSNTSEWNWNLFCKGGRCTLCRWQKASWSLMSLVMGPPLHTAHAYSSFGRMEPMKTFLNTCDWSLLRRRRKIPTRRAQEVCRLSMWLFQVNFWFNMTPRCLWAVTCGVIVPSMSTLPLPFVLIGKCSLFSAL